MTALSVFPGQTAKEVSPNPKCNNCLHYMSNGGRSGVCVIGLSPWLCGDGDNQVAGYAPLDGQAPSDPGSFADPGRANANVDQLQMVPMSLTVLGDEHAEMAKSIHDELDRPQKMCCPLHQNSGVAKSYNASVGAVVCQCKRIASKSVAQKLWKALENKERVHLTFNDVVFFVRGIRKGMTPFDIAISKLHAGTDNSGLNKSLYAPDKLKLGDNNALAKSLYGDDWTSQFTGTPLFDEAVKLREREIEHCEAELKRRIERAAQRKKEAAQAAKIQAESPYDYEAEYQRDEKLRIDKSKLMLKLQQHRNKQLSPKKG